MFYNSFLLSSSNKHKTEETKQKKPQIPLFMRYRIFIDSCWEMFQGYKQLLAVVGCLKVTSRDEILKWIKEDTAS